MSSTPGTRKQKMAALVFFSSVSTIAIVLFALSGAGVFDTPTKEAPTPTARNMIIPALRVPPGAIHLSAERLEMVYGSNIAAANAMYRGKLLLVSGVVDPGFVEPGDEPYFWFKATSPALAGIHVSMQSSERSKISDLSGGDSISVLCRGNGVSGSIPQLDDCLVETRAAGTDAILADQIKATLVSDGENLDGFRYSQGLVDCSINEGAWFTVGPAGLRNHLSGPLRDFFSLAAKFPQIREMDVTLEDPGAPKKDQYGHDIPAGMALTAYLRIDADDFRKFSKEFDWNSYPVYAANRYTPSIGSINWSLRDIWQAELADEIRLGGFR